ncbi:unnamed protein product, partial [Polarella glacialis]
VRNARAVGEGRRPGTAPAGVRPTVGSTLTASSSNFRPLALQAAENPERGLERERRRICGEGVAGAGRNWGPVPTWEYEEIMEQRTRAVGGRHTRPGSAHPSGASAGAGGGLKRIASAGRLRPAKPAAQSGTGLPRQTSWLPKARSSGSLHEFVDPPQPGLNVRPLSGYQALRH